MKIQTHEFHEWFGGARTAQPHCADCGRSRKNKIHTVTPEPAPFYTHADHASACAKAAAEKRVLKQHVQVAFEGSPVCAVIKDAWDVDGKEMWKLDVEGLGRMSFPVRLVRQCSGLDDRCQCEKLRK